MKNNNSRPNLIQTKLPLSKQRNNPSSTLKQQSHFQLITNHYQSKDFHFRRYPFQSCHNQSNSLLKTTLSCKIEKLQLQKLINITHPNLINIRKIIRGHPKQHTNLILQDYFSFYYQNVIFSLRRVASMAESSSLMLKNIQQVDFKTILSDLTEYLLDNQIYHKINLDDIGLNQSLQIKIYLSPAIACSLEKQPLTQTQIYRNNQNLVNWWKTTFSVQQHNQDYLQIPQRYSFNDAEIKFNPKTNSNKSSCIINQANQELQYQNQNSKQNNIQRYEQKYRPLSFSIDRHYEPLTSTIQRNIQNKSKDKAAQELKQSQKTLASHANQLEKAKIKKIHQQIQNIKKRVYKTSFDYKFRKQSEDNVIGRKKAMHTLNSNQKQIFQSAKFQNKKHHQISYPQVNNYNYQPIQQNINCINIYNHSPSKNKMLKPVISYNIIPLSKSRNTINYNSHGIIEQTKSNTDSQSNDSFHIEENQPPQPNSFYRHSLQPKECHPLLNFRNIDKPSYSPTNQIKITNKNVTESAGPLQFKSIINKVIKPQFLSKKSNIYEDPFEDQSEHSLLHEEHKKNMPSNFKKQQKGEIQYLKNLIKQNMQDLKMQNASNKKDRTTEHSRNEKQMKIIQKDCLNKKSQSNLFKKYKKMQNLNLRIKQVLLKSKNAIQLLNQAKSSKSINRRCLSP